MKYPIKPQKQGVQDCVQSSAVQILEYYGINKTIEQIKAEVPVYVDEHGEALGTSLGHIAAYFLDLGFKATIYTTETQIFDRTWIGKDRYDLIHLLEQRLPYVKHAYYDQAAIKVISDGFIQFLQKDGQIIFPVIDGNLLRSLLEKGPIYAVVHYNFFHDLPHHLWLAEKLVPDDIQGKTSTHAVVISGYEKGKFIVVDPDAEVGGELEIDEGKLIGSLYLAQTDLDNLLITLEK